MKTRKYRNLIKHFLTERREELSSHVDRLLWAASVDREELYRRAYEQGYWHGATDSIKTVQALSEPEPSSAYRD